MVITPGPQKRPRETSSILEERPVPPGVKEAIVTYGPIRLHERIMAQRPCNSPLNSFSI